jgi:predicted  nucleic acid-binding Zn-ribbon protein
MPIEEKLDLILQTVQNNFKETNERLDKVDSRLDKVEGDIMDLRVTMNERFNKIDYEIKELQGMDKIILDEVERVHNILEKHKKDPRAHQAYLTI